jgi:hypothetical protein
MPRNDDKLNISQQESIDAIMMRRIALQSTRTFCFFRTLSIDRSDQDQVAIENILFQRRYDIQTIFTERALNDDQYIIISNTIDQFVREFAYNTLSEFTKALDTIIHQKMLLVAPEVLYPKMHAID